MSERTSDSHVTKAVSNLPAHILLSAGEVRELIASRAYELYKARGTEFGDELNDWLRAEAEVTMLLAEPSETADLENRNGRPPARTRKATGVRKAANGARPRVNRWSKRRNALKSNPA